MTERKLTWLCVNGASGSNDPAALDGLLRSLADGGVSPLRTIDLAENRVPDRSELEAAGVDLLAIFTGDGSASAVAAACEGWGGEVLILPGGTANLLAHALHGDRLAADILADLPGARVVRHTCIRTSQGTAMIEVLAGPGATWSDVREDLREGNIGAVAASSLAAIRESTVGSMVALVNPALGRPEGYAGLRLEPEGRGLKVEGYGADTVADYLKQGLALLRRNFRTGPHEDLGTVPEVVCRSLGDGPIELMIDGERHTGGQEERFVLDQLDLNLLTTTA